MERDHGRELKGAKKALERAERERERAELERERERDRAASGDGGKDSDPI